MKLKQEKKDLRCIELFCEKCGWTKEVPPEDVIDWDKKMCPACGKSVIIDDKELKALGDILKNNIKEGAS